MVWFYLLVTVLTTMMIDSTEEFDPGHKASNIFTLVLRLNLAALWLYILVSLTMMPPEEIPQNFLDEDTIPASLNAAFIVGATFGVVVPVLHDAASKIKSSFIKGK